MSELQTEDNATLPEAAEHQTTETVNDGSDLAPDSQGQGEQSGQDGDAAQKAINKKHFQFKEAERLANSYKAKLDAIDREKEQAQLTAPVPSIPDMPDRFDLEDDEYNRRMLARDSAIKQSAAYGFQQDSLRQQQEQQQAKAQAEHSRKNAEIVEGFYTKAANQGIDKDEVSRISDDLGRAGLSGNPELAAHIMTQEDGPIMAKYLAANPIEMESLLTANPYQVGTVLASIGAKAAALKPKQTNAPDPTGTLSGNGADPDANQYQYISGSSIDVGEKWS